MKPTKHILPMLAALLLVSPALAGLLEADHDVFGPKSLTIDTRTGLTWLDVTLSTDMSYEMIKQATHPGGIFEGFRYAGVDDVVGLFESAGIMPGIYAPTDPGFTATAHLISLIGETFYEPGNSYPSSYSITGTLAGDVVVVSGLRYGYPISQEPRVLGYEVMPGAVLFGGLTRATSVGNWLVMVPEPSVTLLTLIGALGLCVSHRCRES